jgi:histidinol-phosphate aminotransferase
MSDAYWSALTKSLSPYVPGEQPKERQYIKLNTNENPYPPSPAVLAAIKNAADEKLRLYPDPESSSLVRAIAKTYNVNENQVFVGNGSDEILAFAFAAFFNEVDDEKSLPILFPDIMYSFYPVYSGLWNIPFKTIPLTKDFSINVDDYKIQNGGVIFPNPNAPTGKVLAINEMLSLAEYLQSQKKVFIVDEAYIDFGGESLVPYVDQFPNLLVIQTMSKSRSLAGLRLGFAIGNENLIEGIHRVKDSFNSYPVDRLAQAGAEAAILDTEYFDETRNKIIVTRNKTVEELQQIGFEIIPSMANFIFIRHEKITGEKLFQALREKGILVRHFNKARIENFLRVTIGTDDEMNVFVETCKEIIDNLFIGEKI